MKLKIRKIEKIDQTKRCFCKNSNKIDKSLARLTKNKREETINNIQSEAENSTTNPTGVNG